VSHRPSGAALRQFRTLFHLGTTGDLSDGQLLERFATGRGEASELAFEAIVERHGPLVLRVCRAVLRDEHDAQDAFQATFLVLVRKAPSLWVRDSLGPWLHSVAHRAARCSRGNRRRRRSREETFPTIDPGLVAVDPSLPDDLAEVLHAEIARLPHRHRDPVILCDLEGLTLEQAARRLGCPVGTVKSRLSRARDRLRDRLSRRGLAPEGRVSPVIALGGARVLVPSGLVRSTIELAVQSASGSAAGVAIPAAVALIAQGVSSAMFQLKIAQLAVPVLAVALSAGAGLGAYENGRPASGTAPGGDGTGQSDGDERGGGILLLEVPAGTPALSVTARGNVEAARVVEVRSPIEGSMTIASIVPEGTRAEEGDLVCELDPAPLLDRLEFIKLSEARSGKNYSESKNLLQLAETNLKEYLDGIYLQERQAEGELEKAESVLARANDRLEWSDDMLRLGYISQEQNRSDRADVLRAEEGLKQARNALEAQEKVKANTVNQIEAKAEELTSRMVESKAELDAAQEQIAQVRKQIDQTAILVTEAGMVVYAHKVGKLIKDGAEVEGDQPILEIIDMDSPMRVNAKVPEAWVDRVRLGQRARIEVDAFPEMSLDGEVTTVHPLPDPTSFFRNDIKVYTTLVELDEPSPMLRPGMTAEVQIRVSEETDTIRIPSKAVLRHDGGAYVAVRLPGGGFAWREVSLGLSNGQFVEVEGGVTPGDLLVLDPIALLRRGSGDKAPGPPTDPGP
jgi:RND family efflux transporter MFP subunit